MLDARQHLKTKKSMIINAISVDIEDWFQVGAFEKSIYRDSWDDLERRVERNSEMVLDLFAQTGVTVLFSRLAGLRNDTRP